MKFSFTSRCLGKDKDLISTFLITLTWQTQLMFIICIKTINKLYEFLTSVIFCFKNPVLLHTASLKCFIYCSVKKSYIIHGAAIRQLIIKSTWFLFLWKKYVPFKLLTTYSKEKSNHKNNKVYLTDSQYSTCLLKNNLAYSICHRVKVYRLVKRLPFSFF